MYALHQIAGIRWQNESNSNSYIFYERVNFTKRKLNEEQNGLVTVNNRERAAVKDDIDHDDDDDAFGDSDAQHANLSHIRGAIKITLHSQHKRISAKCD